MLNEKKNSKWKIVIIFVIPLIFIIMINITNAIWYDPFNWFNSQDEITLEPAKPSRNTYIINQAKDISVDCYNDKGVTYIEDGQGRILSFTGISNGYCKSIPDGQEIFFEKTIDSPVLSKDSIAPIVIVSANTKDAFDYLDWSVVEKEYSKPIYDNINLEEQKIIGYDVKPQAWDYSINKINDYTQEISFTLKKDYTLELGDTFIIDPTYTISNISLDADLDGVTCEGGGYFCHSSINLTDGLIVYMPFDVENVGSTVYDWTNNNNDGVLISAVPFDSTGRVGGAYDFEGNDDRIVILTSLSLDTINDDEELTISMWVKSREPYESFPNSFRDTWYIYKNGTDRIYLQFHDTGVLVVYNDINNLGTGKTLADLSAENELIWNLHTYNFNSSGISFFYNGAYKSRIDVSIMGGPLTDLGDGFRIGIGGDDNAQGDRHWNGTMDEVMIFNRSLSGGEISNIYTESFPRFQPQGTQDFNQTISLGDNRVNITVNLANQNVTVNLSLSIFDGTTQTDSQNMTDGVNATFIIDSGATELDLNFTYIESSGAFWSPILLENITIETFTVSVADTESPLYSDNSTNSTIAGRNILHNLKWTDDEGLDGYIFSFCDGNWNGSDCLGGDMFNITQSSRDGGGLIFEESWDAQSFNFTNKFELNNVWILLYKSGASDNPTCNLTINIRSNGGDNRPDEILFSSDRIMNASTADESWYTWESFGFSNVILDGSTNYWFSFENTTGGGFCDVDNYITIGWYESDIYSNGVNSYSLDGGVSWTREENRDLSFIVSGETLEFINDSFVPMTGASNYSNVSKLISSTVGLNYAWQVYANDTSNNWNVSEVFSYVSTAANVAPTTPILNAPLDLTYILDSDLNIPLNWSNSTDADGDAITYYLEVWNESAMTNIMYVNASITETTNTTGDIVSFPNESSADFFWRVRAMDVTNSLNSSFSSLWNISIGYTTVEDTCDCSSIQGGTTIDCTENCDIGVCNVGGIDMTFSGAGNIYLTGDVENYADVYIYNGCNVYCTTGCFI